MGVVSPFCDEETLSMLADLTSDDKPLLLGRSDQLAVIPEATLGRFANVSVLDERASEDDREDPDANTLQGLHAKLFVAERGWDTSVTVGSGKLLPRSPDRSSIPASCESVQTLIMAFLAHQLFQGRPARAGRLNPHFEAQRGKNVADLRVSQLSHAAVFESIQGRATNVCFLRQRGLAQSQRFTLMGYLLCDGGYMQHNCSIYKAITMKASILPII
jgi:hypothetical protein